MCEFSYFAKTQINSLHWFNFSILDKIVGGASYNIVIFLFLVICDLSRFNLLSQTNEKTVQKIIETNGSSEGGSLEKSEVIVSKAIDLWLSNKNYKDFHPSKYKNLDQNK